MVVYLTTKRDRPDPAGLHIEIGSAPKPSIALCDQIKTVDTRRLDKCCGHVTDEEMAQIDDAIRRALGLEEEAPRTERRSGVTGGSFENDKELKEAIDVLKDKKRYTEILKNK